MKSCLLFLLSLLPLSAQPTWTSFRNAPYTNPPYPTSWYKPLYDPISHTVLIYVNDQGDSIYANSFWAWSTAASTMTKIGTSGSTGTNGSNCPAVTASWPRDRHPYGQMSIDTHANVLWLSDGANQVCPTSSPAPPLDLWKLALTATPTGDTWTRVNLTSSTLGQGENGCAYDGDDDVTFCFGEANTTLLCSANLNPTPGTFTAKQTAAGCVNNNDFTTLTTSGTAPTATSNPGVAYDKTNKKILVIGAFTPGPTRLMSLTVNVYDVPTKTWSNPAPSGMPPVPNQYDPNYIGVPLDFNVNDGKFYYYKPDSAVDGLYTIAYPYSSWVTVCTTCQAAFTTPYNAVGMAVDVSQNALVIFNNSSSSSPANSYDGKVFVATLTNPVFAPITITEKAATTTTNYPIQLGRVFVQGAIANYPQAVINGTPVTTQADVMSRWPDTSVKHAVLSFLIPSLASGSTITVAFQNQTGCNCGSGSRLSQATMLGSGYDFNAQIVLTGGVSATADARTMLNAGSWTYWLQGSINTCALIADDSLTRAYDIGSDSHKSLRPRFEACFWPTINKVRVRITLEDADTIALQDQSYSVVLKTGNASPATVLTQTSITHSGMTRWSREFWINTAPTAIEINHDFTYLASTKQIFNYNQAATPTATSELASWASSPHDLFYTDSGFYTKYMPTTGGRQEIAPLPLWVVIWAYTQNYQMWDVLTRMSELSMTWPVHFREGTNTRSSGTRFYDQAHALAALGLPVSTAGHPTLALNNPTGSSDSSDNITAVGTLTDQGWTPDQSHGFDAWNLVYLLRGEYTDYEESLFWHSYNSLEDSADSSVGYGRGPTGAESVLTVVQTRATAWVLRTRANLAWAAPDGAIGTELIQGMADAFSAMEGGYNITTGSYNGNPVWTWQAGKSIFLMRDTANNPSPLGQVNFGDTGLLDGLNTSTVARGVTTWEEDFMVIAVGRAVELGFSGTPTLAFLGQRIVGELTNSGYNYFLAAAYEQPAGNMSNTWFGTTFTQLKTGYLDPNFTDWTGTMMSPGDAGNCADCYRYVAMSASSFTTSLTNGGPAWSLIAGILLGNSVISASPQFAIVPRGAVLLGGSGLSGQVKLQGQTVIH